MKKKLLSIGLVVALTVSAFAGCGKKEENNAEKSNGKVKEIRFMDVTPNPAREQAFQELIEEFNKQNSDIKVVYESTPWDQSHNKLVTLGSAGSLPDVFVMHQQWNAEFTGAEWVAPLDDYIAEWDNADKIIPYVKNVLMDYDQKNVYGYTFGIPDGLSPHAMFVRNDWMKEAGVTEKDLETWEGIFEASKKMTIPDKDQYGFGFRGARMGSEQMGMYLIAELGGKLYEEDGTCRINTPEGLEAFKKYCDLYLKGYSPKDAINWGYTEMVQGFTSGLTGIMNQTSEVVGTCEETMEDGTWTTIPFPKASDGKLYSKCDSYYLAMSNQSKNKDEAWKFIEFMLEPENNFKFCDADYRVPVMEGAEDDPRFAEMKGFIAGMSDPTFVREPFYGYFSELGEFMETYYDAEMQKYLLGQQSAEESVKNISDYLTTAQQKYMKENPDTPLPRSVTMDGVEVK